MRYAICLKCQSSLFPAPYRCRSTHTVWLCMQQLGLEWVPVYKHFGLNERNYGALVGRNKAQCTEEYGSEQVRKWRRSWDSPPPPMSTTSEFWPGNDPRYLQLGITEAMIPRAESLKDVTKRSSVFWDQIIVPDLKASKKVLIVGHENNLRSIIKRLDNISDEDILHIELPRGIPLVYHLESVTLKPIKATNHAPGLSGEYLEAPEVLRKIYENNLKIVYGKENAIKMAEEKYGKS